MKILKSRSKNQNTNLASEFYVASKLFRLGYTLGHTKEIDIVAINPIDGKIITIDVKGLKNKTNWPLIPRKKAKSHYFILVAWCNKFNDPSFQPEIFVVPSTKISKLLTPWSGNPKVLCVGYTKAKNSKYKNAWSLLV